MAGNFEGTDGEPLTLEQIGFKFENVPVYSKTTFQKVCPGVQIAAAEGTALNKLWYTVDSNGIAAWRNANGIKKTGEIIRGFVHKCGCIGG